MHLHVAVPSDRVKGAQALCSEIYAGKGERAVTEFF